MKITPEMVCETRSDKPFIFYKYRKCGSCRDNQQPIYEITDVFRFRSHTKVDYLIKAQYYSKHFIAIKFHRRDDKKKPDRYRYVNPVGPGNPREVMRFITNTVLKVLSELISKHPNRSIVFIGMNSVGEPINETKRFRIYKIISTTFFPNEKWLHFQDSQYSFYAILNRKADTSKLIKSVKKIYEDYDVPGLT